MSAQSEIGAAEKRIGRERRRFRRKSVLDRQLVTVDLGDGRAAILIDVSEDGIAVQPIRPLKLGTRLKVDFVLPREAGAIQGQGDVVWVGRTGRAGIRFSHLTQKSWCDLDKWLRVVEDPLSETIASYCVRHGADLASEAAEAEGEDKLDLQTVLDMITERACTATNADGATLVVASAGEYVCCSTVGEAPDAGVIVLPQSLTGQSLRHGVSAISGDIKSEPNANLDGEQFASSAIVVPILAESKVIGGIVVFSAKKDAFTERDTGRLKRLAEIAAKLADELAPEAVVREEEAEGSSAEV